ncbi:hypothetical protein DRN58_04915 [Thermococci archaeon]|nr:MAG: hypothetical protein DRN58_04915 [Thermococci archaeon]
MIYAEIRGIKSFSNSKKTLFLHRTNTFNLSLWDIHDPIIKGDSIYFRWILIECIQIHIIKYQIKLTKFYKRLL